MEKVLVSLDKNLLTRLDEEVSRLGHGASRSGFITEALEYYLMTKRGFKNIRRKQELKNEALKEN